MIRIGIVGCGRILAAHLRGYRLLREAGVDDFCITALCSRKADDARGYVSRDQGPAQRVAVSDIPGDPLAVGEQYLSDFQPEVDVQVYTDYRQMIAEAPIDADDTVMASFETERGVVGNLFASWGGHGEETVVGEGGVFYGSRGRVTGDQVILDGPQQHQLTAHDA